MTMKILIDNGHGIDTKGKRSPDGRLLEYAYAREIALRLENELKAIGYDAERIVTEENDIPLKERCCRVNDICKSLGTGNVILISVHCNAAGDDGKWHTGHGWEAWTSVGNTKADILATHLYAAAERKGFKTRKDMTDGDPDKEGHLYILKHTLCPAVLTENLFQDNREDDEYLLSEVGKQAIVKLHVDGVESYIKSLSR